MADREWVLLSYRLPREPSTPRITVWRKLKKLGVAQLGDGLVALPADAFTREQLEWLAQEIEDHAGTAMVWVARPAARQAGRDLRAQLSAERAAEYEQVTAEATAAAKEPGEVRLAARRRLAAELDRIGRRDYFRIPQRVDAHAAVHALGDGS